MALFSRNWGFLTPVLTVIPAMTCVLLGFVVAAVFPGRLRVIPMIGGFPVGMVVAGLIAFFVGRSLNAGRRDDETSTYWFVRIEHWGIVSLVLSIFVALLAVPLMALVVLWPESSTEIAFTPEGRPHPPFVIARPDAPPLLPADEEFDIQKLSASDLSFFAQLAIKDGENEMAADLQRWAIDKGSTEFYNLACYESLCGRAEDSLYWLQEAAIHEGVNVAWSQEDSDLENLRADWRWPQVLAFLEACDAYWQESGLEDHQLVLPADYDGQPIPTFVWLHGKGDRAASYVFPSLQEIADRERVAFVSVSGTLVNGPKSYSWSDDMDRNEARIDAALAKFGSQLKVQEGRIALGGFSQGGQVAGELAARSPQRYSGALLMSPGGFTATLPPVYPTSPQGPQTIVAVCGAGEHPATVKLTERYAQWFEGAGAKVMHRADPDLDTHTLVPDFDDRLPEWIPALLKMNAD
jgi:predicted esterase